MKKMTVVLVSLVVMLALLAGPALAEKVTLTYGNWGTVNIEGIEAQIAKFQSDNPNIQVKLQLVPWSEFWVKLQITVAAGTAWDVFWMNSTNADDFARRGAVLDITDLIKRDKVDLSPFFPSAVEVGETDGRQYFIPRDISQKAITYNKNLFKEAGLAYLPYEVGDNWTWTDLILTAEKLTKKDSSGKTLVYGFTGGDSGYLNLNMYLYAFAYSAGWYSLYDEETEKITLDTPGFKLGVQLAKDLVRLGISPKWGEIERPFLAGRSAMDCTGSWMMSYYTRQLTAFEWAVAPFPAFLRPGATTPGPLGDAICAKTKHTEEAWKFVKWLISKEGAEIIAGEGSIIPARRDATRAWVEFFPQEHRKDAQVFVDAAKYMPVDIIFPGAHKVWERVDDYYLPEIYAGRLPLDEGIAQLQKEATEIVEETIEALRK